MVNIYIIAKSFLYNVFFFFLFYYYLFGVTYAVVAACYHTVTGFQSFEDLELLRVLPPHLNGNTACYARLPVKQENPLAAALLIEVSTRNDNRRLGLPQLHLHTVALAKTYIIGGRTVEEKVDSELTLLDLGHHTAYA